MATVSPYFILLIVAMVSSTSVYAIKCFQCGQYNDGVGSITPCINSSNMSVKDCPSLDHKYCIKYVSEGSIVRDCVGQCTEKEVWGTKTYCCDLDGCNSSHHITADKLHVLITAILSLMLYKMAAQ